MFYEFKSIIDLVTAFPTEQDCINHLEKIRWNGAPVSPFDPNSVVYKCKGNKYKCKETGKYFNVKVGTVFEDTKIPLIKWFMALYVFSSHKKGISSHQLSRDIDVTQKTAWFMLHRLRYAFEHPIFKEIVGDGDFISLTNMVANQEEGSKLIEKWLTNKNTIEFLGIWEQLNNKNFNSPEFGGIMNDAGTNRFYMSVKQWVSRTSAIGIAARTGSQGGTYAHRDIAFNFALYISPVFNLILIKEFQRLKEIESNQYGIEWNFKRVLSKANYHIHTQAVKNYIVPKAGYTQAKEWLLYADEADLLNIALFGTTAKQWRDANPTRVLNGENIRDMASINELAILSNLESLNSILIKNGLSKKDRFKILRETVLDQRKTLDSIDMVKSIKKENSATFIEHQKKELNNDNITFDQTLKGLLNTPPPKKEK